MDEIELLNTMILDLKNKIDEALIYAERRTVESELLKNIKKNYETKNNQIRELKKLAKEILKEEEKKQKKEKN